jgi:acyl carrier protein
MKTQVEIVEEIANHLGIAPGDLNSDDSLTDDLGLGPIEVSELFADLAQKFQVTFDPNEREKLTTINDLVVYVEDLMLE